ncbi:hypothetical protein PIIN_10450 [Serendipita indica DSM 11827]|uniref:C2H2-type domain-containing protein n=1 Tax=Serendipita indica (strain DSM 11827) TaxID=1109443 RepID=G4TYR4_SERID|nr:hypothetical protein PIIN_10450 [Serendipita indica DSM 11827]
MNNQHPSAWASGLQLQLEPPAIHTRVAKVPEGSHRRYPPTPYPHARHAQLPSEIPRPQPGSLYPPRVTTIYPPPVPVLLAKPVAKSRSPSKTPTYESAPAPPPMIVRLPDGWEKGRRFPLIPEQEPPKKVYAHGPVFPDLKREDYRPRCGVCLNTFSSCQDLNHHYKVYHPEQFEKEERRVRQEERLARERKHRVQEEERRAEEEERRVRTEGRRAYERREQELEDQERGKGAARRSGRDDYDDRRPHAPPQHTKPPGNIIVHYRY